MTHYLAFYKPDEVLSQFTDTAGRDTLKNYISVQGVYAAGRLDYHSEGLMVLSDEGAFIRRLTDPRFSHPKTYLAQVEGLATEEMIRPLKERIVLPGLQTRLAQVEIIPEPPLPPRPRPVRGYHPTNWLKIILFEGKKHQVRRMTAAVGLPTLRLVRVAIGALELGSLKPGQWRELTQTEIRAFN
jgi:23S rRNA pseudouridine2457 synthase